TTLSWSTTGATSLAIDNGIGSVAGTSVSATPAVTTTYVLTATNGAGSSTASLTITVLQKPVITSFTASATSINVGQSPTLSWSTIGATSLAIDNGIGSVAGTSVSVTPAVTTTYLLTATNAAGSSTASVTVTVLQKPVVGSFTASATSINVGQPTTLSWSTT